MHTEFRGRAVYQAELDLHFPHLTVRQILALAARIRAPQGAATEINADAVIEETATTMRLCKALDTKVGNDFVQGVSGGERKRTSIAVRAINMMYGCDSDAKGSIGDPCWGYMAAVLGQ